MTHLAQWQITDVSIVNEYFVGTYRLSHGTWIRHHNSVKYVFLYLSRRSSIITVALLLLPLLVS